MKESERQDKIIVFNEHFFFFNTSYSVKIPPAKYPFINNSYQCVSINKVADRLCIIT